MIAQKIPTILVGKSLVYLVDKQGLTQFKNITELSQKIKSKQINLLLASDLAYFQFFSFPLEKTVDQAKIALEFQKEVPFDLNQVGWTHKLWEKTKTNQIYWAMTPVFSFLQPFIKALQENKFEIKTLSFLPFLVWQNLQKNNESTLAVFIKEKIKFILISTEEKIWFYDLPDETDQKIVVTDLKVTIAELIKSLKKHYQVEIKKLVSISDQDLAGLKLKIEPQIFDFGKTKFISLIEDDDVQEVLENEKRKKVNMANEAKEVVSLKKSDEVNSESTNNVGGREIEFTETEAGKDETKGDKTTNLSFWQKNKKTLVLILILIMSLVLLFTLVWFRFFKNKENPASSPNAEKDLAADSSLSALTVTPVPASGSASASPSALLATGQSTSSAPSATTSFPANLYSVQILNGAGIAGLASKTQDLLEQNGFDDFAVGNAERSDYAQTEIITNDAELKKELLRILEGQFEINPNPSETSVLQDFDAMIILGKN